MPRESHQNEVGRSHRSVAFYLRSSRNIALPKIHFKYFLGLYSLEKEHKIAKINLVLSHRPCFDDSFPGPERVLGIMHSVYKSSLICTITVGSHLINSKDGAIRFLKDF